MSKIGCRIVLVTALLVFPANTINADGNIKSEDQQDCYETHLDKMIEKCDRQKKHRNSSSKEMRKRAALLTMKAAYLREYKAELIEEMAREQVGSKSHHIQHYLNSRFFEIAKTGQRRYGYETHSRDLQSSLH